MTKPNRNPQTAAANPKRKRKPARRKLLSRALVVRGAGGVVAARFEDGPKILLIKNIYDNRWAVPKGHVDPGETSEQAAVREVTEETGITARIRQPLGKNTYYFRGRRGREAGRTVKKTVELYLMDAVGDTTIHPEKLDPHDRLVKGARWFTPTSAVRAIPYANLQPIVKKAATILREDTRV